MRFYLISGILFLTLIAVALSRGIQGTVVCFGDSIAHGAKVNGHSWIYFLSNENIKILIL